MSAAIRAHIEALCMFIAHAPAGYLIVKLSRKFKANKAGVLTAVVASAAPDLDMFYFYLVDNKAHVHHSYWTHVPLFWVGGYALALLTANYYKSQRMVYYANLIFVCVMGHLLLDSVTENGILWAYPFSMHYFSLFTIPSVHNWWILNYLLYWTFLIELSIVGAAIYLAVRGRALSRKLKPHTG